MATINFEGADALKAKLSSAGPLATAAIAAALVAEQEAVITEAKQRTPVDTGTLRGSGTVLPPQMNGTKVEVVSGFGGAASEYAVAVHEDMTANHPTGRAKFLESAFIERASQMGKTLGAGIAAALGRLGK